MNMALHRGISGENGKRWLSGDPAGGKGGLHLGTLKEMK
jgi:hypothetical protein